MTHTATNRMAYRTKPGCEWPTDRPFKSGGVTLAYTCEQTDPSTVVRKGVFEGHAFLSETSDMQVTITFTVEDGLITSHQFDARPLHRAFYLSGKGRDITQGPAFE